MGPIGTAESITAVIDTYPDRVAAWMDNEPGAWGYLAGQTVLAERHRLGRALTDRERRIVWQLLWDRLTLLRVEQAGDGNADARR